MVIRELVSGMKKILYVITKSNWGGAQRYVFDLATNLSKDRFDVAVACGGNGFLIEKLKAAGIRVIPIHGMERDIRIFREIALFWTLFFLFRKEKPDIIHLNSSKAGGLGALAAFFYKILHPRPYTPNWASPPGFNLHPRIIFTAHGWAFNESRPWWQIWLVVLASRFAALFQDTIINISEHGQSTTLQRHITQKVKTTVVYPAVKTEDFLPKEESRTFLFPEGIDENTLYVGTIAELTKNKGLHYLVNAINQMVLQASGFRLYVLVIGDGEKKQALQEKINALGLAHIIRLTGFIPDAAQYLKAFDIFVLPSLKEGFPYVLLESSAAGIPIIATRVGGIPELIENGENGLLVPPENASALAEAIGHLANDAEMRQRFVAAGIKKIRERFSFSNMLEKTIAVYNS